MNAGARRLRVLHVVYRFDIGGLENVIVQLINRLPAERFEHVVLSLTTVSDFRQRVEREGVRFIALDKPPGHALKQYPAIWRLLREIRPDVLHSCNLAPLEVVPVAWAAGVPWRVHVEHGWDAHDPQGQSAKYRWLRRAYAPFVSRFVSVSADLDRYLGEAVGVPAAKRHLIGNGVDTRRFSPGPAPAIEGCPFEPGRHWLVGTVGRLMTVKNQPLLARAFVRWLRERPELAARARLVIVGEGGLRAEVERVLDEAGLRALAWLPGARSDVAAILRALDVFEDGVSGLLVPSDDEAAMARALNRLHDDAPFAQGLARAARERAEQHYSIDRMVDAYAALFARAAAPRLQVA